MNLDSPIKSIKGIGPKTEQLFAAAGVYTVGDILLYFPRDYERYPEICGVDGIVEDRKNAIFVRTQRAPSLNARSRMQTAVLDVAGEEKKMRILWFRSPYIRSVVKPQESYIFVGKVTRKQDIYYMEQPEVMSLEKYREIQKTLQPVYPLTKGLTNNLVRKTVMTAIREQDLEMEYLPEDVRARNHLSEYNFALANIHMPADEQSCIAARNRFVFDEFFFFILAMQMTKDSSAVLPNRWRLGSMDFVHSLTEKLPYRLTDAQERTLKQVLEDLRSDTLMQRLIQGDVGSGKTIIAFLAMLDCASSGYQSAMMAPTDVLARQHYQKMKKLCEDFDLHFPVVLLTGSLGARERREAYERIAREPAALIIGTHALIQEKVNYRDLALVITDEQHRFGVKQRESFFFKGGQPHIMVMSATPIPRTLAIILYGDLDISVIDEVPAQRKAIKNCVVDTSSRQAAYRFMEKQIRQGHQVYIICPLVEASEHAEGENVLEYSERLREIFPADIVIGCLHGKMKPEEKNRVMEDFLDNRIQILVSTTVVEVGVDVPNATAIMIENAERYGLAQLHQLRGRVGRSDHQSYCILMQGKEQKTKNRRLEILNSSNDGFYIAGEDLKLRGPGDFFGIRQSGDFQFRLADIYQDADLLSRASYEVSVLMKEDPKLAGKEHQALKNRLKSLSGSGYSLLNL